MKTIITICSLILSVLCIRWDQLSIDPSARGTLNNDENYWTGGLDECDTQCKAQGGSICGTSQRQCCHEKECGNKFGLVVCNNLLEGFKCSPSYSSPFKLYDTIHPNTFPEYAQMYQHS